MEAVFVTSTFRGATGSSVSAVDAPVGLVCIAYDVYKLSDAKNPALKAFRGLEHCSVTSVRVSRRRARDGPSHGPSVFTAPSRCAGVPDRLMLNDYIPYTFIVASKVTTRCKLGGCYDSDSSFAPCPVPRAACPSTVSCVDRVVRGVPVANTNTITLVSWALQLSSKRRL